MSNTIYSIIDIETTGGSSQNNKIIEIAIVKYDGEKIIEEFSSLINPEMNIPYTIYKLTGINNDMVQDAPRFYEVAKKIVEMTEGTTFVAHNVFFDYNFIKHEFSELGYQFKRDKLCTVRLARKYLPGYKSYSLGNICKDLGIALYDRHRAMGDAKATVELFKRIQEKQNDLTADCVSSQKISLPSNLDRQSYETIPEKCGVYYFYSKENQLLYIGKSKNIKKRVSSHFRPDMKRKKDILLKTLVARIEYKLLGNELAALLWECHEIKKHRPRYNVSLRSTRTLATVQLKKVKGENTLVASGQDEGPMVFFDFRNKRRAKSFINSLYKTFLQVAPDELEFESKKREFIEKFGLDLYNDLLEKAYYQYVPNKTHFSLTLPGRQCGERCHVLVEDRLPTKLLYVNKQVVSERIGLDKSADLQKILFRSIHKMKIKADKKNLSADLESTDLV